MLDIGGNGGFYSIEMKRRGAERVFAIDFDTEYLAQARFAAKVLGLDIDFARMFVYDVGAIGERFDIIIFMGVLYHLRHPLLALDLIHEHVAREVMIFQSMQRGSREIEPLEENYDFWEPGSSTGRASRSCISSNAATPTTRRTGAWARLRAGPVLSHA